MTISLVNSCSALITLSFIIVLIQSKILDFFFTLFRLFFYNVMCWVCFSALVIPFYLFVPKIWLYFTFSFNLQFYGVFLIHALFLHDCSHIFGYEKISIFLYIYSIQCSRIYIFFSSVLFIFTVLIIIPSFYKHSFADLSLWWSKAAIKHSYLWLGVLGSCSLLIKKIHWGILFIKNPTYSRYWLLQLLLIIELCQKKISKTFWSDSEHLPVLKALCGADLEQNAGIIHESNPEYLLAF